MGCLKCGRETPEGESFCPECQAEMEKYPVKPGTAVLLPQRKEAPPVRKIPKRRVPAPEEQIRSLRRRLRVQAVLLLLALALIGVLSVPAYEHYFEDHYLPGQNYNTIVPSGRRVSP